METTRSETGENKRDLLILGCAAAGLALTLWCALTTIGSTDVFLHHYFAEKIIATGLVHTYEVLTIFNHTPLIASYFVAAFTVASGSGLDYAFPFYLKLPVILANFLTVLLVWRLWRRTGRPPLWAVCLFALSPVSYFVDGYHGNFDSMMVLMLFLAAYTCLNEEVMLCGLFFGLACNIKIISILLSPIFFFYWMHRGKGPRFAMIVVFVCLAGWSPALFGCPRIFLHNVLGYSSYWGIWGLTYWLRMTNWAPFAKISFTGLAWQQLAVMSFLKVIIIGSILTLAWRRRAKSGLELFDTITYAWMIFFVFSPGVCAQYMVWFAPFLAVTAPRWFAAITAASTVFLFFFYDTISHGFTQGGTWWLKGISTNDLSRLWTPWTNLPWLLMILFLAVLVRRWRIEAEPASGSAGLSAASPIS